MNSHSDTARIQSVLHSTAQSTATLPNENSQNIDKNRINFLLNPVEDTTKSSLVSESSLFQQNSNVSSSSAQTPPARSIPFIDLTSEENNNNVSRSNFPTKFTWHYTGIENFSSDSASNSTQNDSVRRSKNKSHENNNNTTNFNHSDPDSRSINNSNRSSHTNDNNNSEILTEFERVGLRYETRYFLTSTIHPAAADYRISIVFCDKNSDVSSLNIGFVKRRILKHDRLKDSLQPLINAGNIKMEIKFNLISEDALNVLDFIPKNKSENSYRYFRKDQGMTLTDSQATTLKKFTALIGNYSLESRICALRENIENANMFFSKSANDNNNNSEKNSKRQRLNN